MSRRSSDFHRKLMASVVAIGVSFAQLGSTSGGLAAAATAPRPADTAGDAAATAATSPAAAREVKDTKLEKFALMIGVNEYQNVQGLHGCLNDVDDMRKTLAAVYNFPDDAQHMITLTNSKATKKAILQAFREHLIANAKLHPNAICVFHFSGHGSQTVDLNGDELDGLDETVCSTDARGDSFDLLDDEIAELFDELSQYTRNVVFILDSCHSGSATRGIEIEADNDDVATRAIGMDTRPQPPQKPLTSSKLKDRKKRPLASGSYVTFSGCRPAETSTEIAISVPGQGRVKRGLLTYSICRAMRELGVSATYRELGKKVSEICAMTGMDQHPVFEGDVNQLAFTDAKAPKGYSRVEQVGPHAVTVTGGISAGFKPGGLLAIYRPEMADLKGDKGLICTAKIAAVSPNRCEALLPENVQEEMLKYAKVVLVTPDFGKQNVTLKLVTRQRPSAAGAQAAVGAMGTVSKPEALAGAIVASFKSIPGVQIAASIGDVDSELSLVPVPPPAGSPASTPDMLSVLNQDGKQVARIPLTDDSKSAVDELQKLVAKRAQQKALLDLSNSASPLNDAFRFRIVRLKQVGGGKRPGGMLDFAKTEPVFGIGDRIQLVVENESDEDLYFTILAASADGSLTVLYPSAGKTTAPVAPHGQINTPPLVVQGPAAREAFKIIATRAPVDLRFLEKGTPDAVRVAGQNDDKSSLVAILKDAILAEPAVSENETSTAPDKQLSLSDWSAHTFYYNILGDGDGE